MKSLYILLAGAALISGNAYAQPAPPPGGMPPGPPPGAMPGDGPPPAMPSMADTKYDAAIGVHEGALVKPISRQVRGSAPSGTQGSGLSIESATPALNGLFVSGGKSAFTLRNSKIKLSGPGTNDFLGIGAGVLVRDNATLVLDGVTVETNGRISSAAVAAEGATLRIYNSRLIANGGPLPEGYKPRIGPGMMEPPAPLGLKGTARTLLAMSNSRTFIYGSHIEADGWGALSTDATGGNLYLEANDSTVVVRKVGYGTYADFGAHVVLNRTRVDSGGDLGIIAGKARIDFNGVTGSAGRNGVVIHSVMAFDPAETAELNLKDCSFVAAGPVVQVKSANASILIEGGAVSSKAGVLLDVRKNDDPNATKTNGAAVPGVRLVLRTANLSGDVSDTDPDRQTSLLLEGSSLTGALHNVTLSLDGKSKWTARTNSEVVLAAHSSATAIDAPAGVTVTARSADHSLAPGRTVLPSGGELIITE